MRTPKSRSRYFCQNWTLWHYSVSTEVDRILNTAPCPVSSDSFWTYHSQGERLELGKLGLRWCWFCLLVVVKHNNYSPLWQACESQTSCLSIFFQRLWFHFFFRICTCWPRFEASSDLRKVRECFFVPWKGKLQAPPGWTRVSKPSRGSGRCFSQNSTEPEGHPPVPEGALCRYKEKEGFECVFASISVEESQRSPARRLRGNSYQDCSCQSVWGGRSGSFRLERGKSWSSQLRICRSSRCCYLDDQFPSTRIRRLKLRWPKTWDNRSHTTRLSTSLGSRVALWRCIPWGILSHGIHSTT